MITRKSFFKSLFALAATVALAPQIAFSAPKMLVFSVRRDACKAFIQDCGNIEDCKAVTLTPDELKENFNLGSLDAVPLFEDLGITHCT